MSYDSQMIYKLLPKLLLVKELLYGMVQLIQFCIFCCKVLVLE